MSVTFTATAMEDFPMVTSIDLARFTDVVNADGDTVDVAGAVVYAVIFDDSAALSTYEDAQIEADAAWTQPDYTDGYAITTKTLNSVDDSEGFNDIAVCVTGTGPLGEEDADGVAESGDPFTSCAEYDSGEDLVTSYTTQAVMTDADDIYSFDAVTEADNIGYNASWVCATEGVTAQWLTDAGIEQTYFTCSRFLPSLGDDGEYSATDLRFDADTVDGTFCIYTWDADADGGDEFTAETYCAAYSTDASGTAAWEGAAALYAGAAIAVAATLF